MLVSKTTDIFHNKLQQTDNPILRTLFHLPTVKYEILGLTAKYGLNGVQGNLSAMKDCGWTCFVQKVRFQVSGLFYHLCNILSSVYVLVCSLLVHCICYMWLHSLRNKSNNNRQAWRQQPT